MYGLAICVRYNRHCFTIRYSIDLVQNFFLSIQQMLRSCQYSNWCCFSHVTLFQHTYSIQISYMAFKPSVFCFISVPKNVFNYPSAIFKWCFKYFTKYLTCWFDKTLNKQSSINIAAIKTLLCSLSNKTQESIFFSVKLKLRK